jgi:hypothetical protein
MAIIKRIVCLANSRKLQGRCIAGRELVGGGPGSWIRPVSDRPHEEVSEYERQYEDGSDPRLMDIIDVPLREPRPKGYQQENWLLDPNEYWVRAGRLSWTDLEGLADTSGTLWLNGHHTQNGQNDAIPLDKAVAVTSSLKLVHIDSTQLRVFKPGEAFGNPKRRAQARFRFDGHEYALWVTDPSIERAYLSREDGQYGLGVSYLTISLGEPFNNSCYKLVAAVIQQA